MPEATAPARSDDQAPALSGDQAVELAEMFHLLGDPNRLRLTLACLDQPVSVGRLAEAIGASQSLVSHHLRLLRAARLLRAERRGKHVYYEAADEHVRSVLRDMVAHLTETDGHGEA